MACLVGVVVGGSAELSVPATIWPLREVDGPSTQHFSAKVDNHVLEIVSGKFVEVVVSHLLVPQSHSLGVIAAADHLCRES